MEEVVMEHLLKEQALPYQPGQFLPLQLQTGIMEQV
jgi:hypothetical protein